MARTNNLTNFLTDVATAIKEKLGSQTAIPASQFDSKIRDIQTVGTYQSKTINISANGSQTVEPDANYDALSSVSINVTVPQLRLQSKVYEFTENSSMILYPETGYDGFSSITLTIAVPGTTINNQNKTVTENGTYTADQGYTGLGTVNVNVPVPVKLFTTMEQMNNSTGNEPGDKAMVYDYAEQHVYEHLVANRFIIRPSVTLDTEYTGSGFFMAFTDAAGTVQINIALRTTSIYVSYREGTGSMTQIQYTSTDGIHYTTSDTTHTNVVLTLSDKYIIYENTRDIWNTVAEKVLFYPIYDFAGIFKYDTNNDNEYFDMLTSVTIDTVNKTLSSVYQRIYEPLLFNMHAHVKSQLGINDRYYLIIKSNNAYYLQTFGNAVGTKVIDNTANRIYFCPYTDNTRFTSDVYSLDLASCTYTKVTTLSMTYTYTYNGSTYYAIPIYDNGNIVCDSSAAETYGHNNYVIINGARDTSTYTGDVGVYTPTFLGWHRLATQYNASKSIDLLPNIIAYGSHGEISGTNSTYNSMNFDDILLTKTDATNVITHTKSVVDGQGLVKSANVTINDMMSPAFDTIITKTSTLLGLSTSGICDGYFCRYGDGNIYVYSFDMTLIVTIPYNTTLRTGVRIRNLSDTELAYCFTDSTQNIITSGVINTINKTYTTVTYTSKYDTPVARYLECCNGHYYIYFAYNLGSADTNKLLKDGNTVITGSGTTDFPYPLSYGESLSDGTYMYCYSANTQQSGSAKGLRLTVWNMQTNSYVGAITNENGAALATDIDLNKVYIVENDYMYLVNGITKTKMNYVLPAGFNVTSNVYGKYGVVITRNNNTVLYILDKCIDLSNGNMTTLPGGTLAPTYVGDSYSMGYKGLQIATTNGYVSIHKIEPSYIFASANNVAITFTDPQLTHGYKHSMLVLNDTIPSADLHVASVHLEGWIDPSTEEETDTWYLGGLEDIDYRVYLTTLHAYNGDGVDIADSVKWEVQIVNNGTIPNITGNVNFGMDSNNNISFLPAANVQSILIGDWFTFKVKCTDVYGDVIYSNELQIENSTAPDDEYTSDVEE